MFLKFSKRKIIFLLISNLLLSIMLLLFSFYSYSVAMNAFEQGTASWGQDILINTGEALLTYLLALVFLFPESVRDSSLGGFISYASAFIMTAPLMLVGSYLIGRISKKFRKE